MVPASVLTAATFFALTAFALEMSRGERIVLLGGSAVSAIGLLTPPYVAAAFLIGTGAARLARPPASVQRGRLMDDLARLVALLVLSAGFTWILPGVPDSAFLLRGLSLLAVGFVFMAVDLLAYGLKAADRDMASGLSATGGLFRVIGAGYIAQICIGVVLVLVYPRLDVFAFLVLTPLMLIMQHTTGLLLNVRAAYMRTVGVLAEVAELQTAGQTGHSQRVSRTAAQLGRALGLGSRQIERLALASLLHDIGRLRVPASADAMLVAEAGATVLSRVSFLASLSPVIQKQALSYGQFLDLAEPDGQMARIVRLASDLDDLMFGPLGLTLAEAIGHVQRSSGRVYDPSAIDALSRIWRDGGGSQ